MKTIKVFLLGKPNFTIEPTRSYLLDSYTFFHSNHKIQFVRLNRNILDLYSLLVQQSDLILICLRGVPNPRNANKQKRSIDSVNDVSKRFGKRILLWSCNEVSDTELETFKGLIECYAAFGSREGQYVVVDGCVSACRVSWLQYIFYCFKIL